MIAIQEEDFSIESLFEQIKQQAGINAGAISTFTGLVREKDQPGQAPLTALKLEHYPGMTEKALTAIAKDAKKQFSLSSIVIVHRIGKLEVGDRIVFVGTSSEHRKSAFNGCQFIMDYLKNDAPFWKKEFRKDGSESWVEQKQSDVNTIKNWQ
ncbi:MAG: molybdenum cofactor biosynthesis protein MoaE [Gammaproteobacteria bacterium]|nr:molybdenum cofactor biosynthesis protein MoaE [Gammaproteobacteria bacterium]